MSEHTPPDHGVPGRTRSPHEPSARLARALHGLLGHARTRPPARDLTEALAYLERDVEEVRTRVNALFFAVLTAGVADVVARTVLR